MKRQAHAFFSILLAIAVIAVPRSVRADWNSTIAASNPLNWYTLDETTGQSAFDHGSEGLNGTYGIGANAPTRGQPGLVGTAVEFTGDAENLIATQNILLNGSTLTGDWTATFVVEKTAHSFSQILLKGSDNFSPSTGLKLEQFQDTHEVGYTEFGHGDYTFTPGLLVPLNQFVVLDYVKTDVGVQLFIDGALAGSNDIPMSLDRVRIGDDLIESIWGVLDDVVVYDRALSAAEVASHFAAVPEPSMFVLAAVGILGLFVVRKRRRSASIGLAFASSGAWFVITGTPAVAASQYHLTDLGTLGGISSRAYGINNSGEIVGVSAPTAGLAHAFRYGDGAMTDLGALASYSQALGINNNGQVVGLSGVSSGAPHAFLYSGSTMTDLGTLGGSNSYAFGVNTGGQVVGIADVNSIAAHPFLYSTGRMIDIASQLGPTSIPMGINNHGQIAGYSPNVGDGSMRAFVYDGTAVTDLGTLGGSGAAANAINDNDQVVGYSYVSGDGARHAFLYGSSAMTDLGAHGISSLAFGLNNLGQVVGYSETATGATVAFLYRDSTMFDLVGLVDNSGQGWTFESARGINDLGQITGEGTTPSGATHAFLLTPVPEPSTFALATLGILGLLAVRKRRRSA